jgi:hypothetical protein
LLLSNSGKGQQVYRIGVLPVISLNKSIKDIWSLNLKLESRQAFVRGEFGSDANAEYNYNLTDIALMGTRKIGFNNSLAMGYKARITADYYFHELRQQFTVVRKYTALRMAYRFAANQIFSEDTKPEFVLRYRMTFAIPLSGQSIDPREFYLKINNEYLNSFAGEIFDFEIRVVPLTGYSFNDSNKIEFGLDYRVSSIFDSYLAHSFWLNLNWYFSL